MTLTYGAANCPSAVAWWTAQRPVNTENHRLPQLAKTLLEIDLEWGGAPLRLFATHLGSRWDIQQPVDEIISILEVLEQRGGDCHVLAGDLNALRLGDPIGTPPSGEIRRGDAADGAARLTIGRVLDAGYVDGFRHIHPRRPGFTYPSEPAWLRLDYIFASPALARCLDGCEIIDARVTRHALDHLPVMVSFHGPASDPDFGRCSSAMRALINGEKCPA